MSFISRPRGAASERHLSLVPSTTRGPAAPNHRGIPSLDGIRAIAILSVIVWHLPGRATMPVLSQLWRIDAGNLGVRIFFVLSGFLITTLLLGEHARTGSIDLGRFFFRRTFRILPAFAVFLIAMAIAATLGLHTLPASAVLHAATFTSNYLSTTWPVGHTWSLSVEEQFYLLWPALIVGVGLRGGVRGAFAMLLVSPLFRTAAQLLGHWPDNPRYGFECVADALATGCLLARYRTQLWSSADVRAFMTSRWFAVVPLVALAASMITVRAPIVGAAVGISALNVSIALMIEWCVRMPTSLPGRVLNARPLALIGTVSYSLYLWQQPFLNETSHANVLARLVALTACAVASYVAIERPALRLRSYVERRYLTPEVRRVPTRGSASFGPEPVRWTARDGRRD